jgi:hypothetical protein
VVRSDLEGDRGLPTTLTLGDSLLREGVTRPRGLRGPLGRGLGLEGSSACSGLAPGRVRGSEVEAEKALEGKNDQESIGCSIRATWLGTNGLAGGSTPRSG